MKLCDRCPGAGSCLLNYLGIACADWRKQNAPDVVITNADRIRAMSDEKLAEFLDNTQKMECKSLHIINEDGTLKFESAKNGWLVWLQQPAEETSQ